MMIASLQGTVASKGSNDLVIQVGGLGFRVYVPKTVLDGLAVQGQDISLFTYLHVRENELTLYGCATKEELSLFHLLLSVSGIGPKVALSMLSFLPPDRLRQAIAQGDAPSLARVPGIGPKTAKKLIFHLKDKVAVEPSETGLSSAPTEADTDLIAALTSLGYSVAEAQEAIGALPREKLSLEERVRLALAYFAS